MSFGGGREGISMMLMALFFPIILITGSNFLATGNPVMGGITAVFSAFDLYIFAVKLIYHRFLKYAAYHTYSVFRHWSVRGRNLLIMVADEVRYVRSPQMTIDVINKNLTEEQLRYGQSGWQEIRYSNDGGGMAMMWAPQPVENLSPPIEAPNNQTTINGYTARTNLHDIGGHQIGRFLDVEMHLPFRTRDKVLKWVHWIPAWQTDRLVVRDEPILISYDYALKWLWERARYAGVKDPEFKSVAAMREALAGVGEELIKIHVRDENEKIEVLEAVTAKLQEDIDFMTKHELGMPLIETARPQGEMPEEEGRGKKWLKLITVIAVVLLAGLVLVAAVPFIQNQLGGNTQPQCNFPQLETGYHAVIFYQSGLSSSAQWTVNLGGSNSTHPSQISPVNSNCVVFAVHNGVVQFKVYPPTGYVARPPLGTLSVNNTNISQVIAFSQITQTSSTTTTRSTSTGSIPTSHN